MAEIEHPESYIWWLSELGSLDVNTSELDLLLFKSKYFSATIKIFYLSDHCSAYIISENR